MSKKKSGKVLRLAKTRMDELASLERRGRLQPQAVVDFAENPRALLHKSFTWDDTKAARLYRLEQARDIIQAYVVTIEGPRGPLNIRAFHSLPSDRQHGGGYRRIDDILKDKALLHELIASAMADLARVRERYEMLAALSPVWRAMHGVAKRHKVARKAA